MEYGDGLGGGTRSRTPGGNYGEKPAQNRDLGLAPEAEQFCLSDSQKVCFQFWTFSKFHAFVLPASPCHESATVFAMFDFHCVNDYVTKEH